MHPSFLYEHSINHTRILYKRSSCRIESTPDLGRRRRLPWRPPRPQATQATPVWWRGYAPMGGLSTAALLYLALRHMEVAASLRSGPLRLGKGCWTFRPPYASTCRPRRMGTRRRCAASWDARSLNFIAMEDVLKCCRGPLVPVATGSQGCVRGPERG